MKLAVLDGGALNPGDLSWDELAALGDLRIYPDTLKDPDKIVERIGDAEAVFTNKTPITAETLARCPSVRYIGVLATGYNVVDVEAARCRNIPVTNVPSYGTDAVAQFTMALLLELCHRVGLHDEKVHAGEWTRSGAFSVCFTPQTELSGKTIGIIGFGRIGMQVGRLARAFGMRVLAWNDGREKPEGRAIGEYVPLDTLLKESDVISLHCPLTSGSREFICRDRIARMKDGVLLVNTARGQLVNEADLKEALVSGKIGAAAVDVVSSEPVTEENPLLTAPNCILTPHIAWTGRNARQRLMDAVTENCRAWLDGRQLNVVNP